MKVIYLGLMFFMILLSSCNSGTGFSGAEETSANDSLDSVTAIVIDSVSPTSDPIIVTDSSEVTFAISLSSGNVLANYKFSLDAITMQSSSSPFYLLSGNTLSTGMHTLEVTVTNPISAASHTFNIVKNTSPSVDSFAPLAINQTVTCGVGTIDFSVVASDVESDPITFSWLIDGAENPGSFSITSNATSSSATFAPSCALTGIISLSAKIYDGHDYTLQTWSVQVTNPNIASIDSFSPSTNPTVILSTQDRSFNIAASGTAPITYKWYLDATEIPGATSAMYDLTSGSLSTGPHTLKVQITDGINTTDEHTFNLVKNAPPSIDSNTPVDTVQLLNYQSTKTLNVSANDPNGDPLTYTWKLDNTTHSQLTSTDSPDGLSSAGLLTPLETMLGNHTVSLVITDGYENVTLEWQITINRFSDACNALEAGEICTLIGPVGLGDESNDPRGRPSYVVEDLDHPGNYFVSDYYRSYIRYHNLSASDLTIFGISIPASQSRVVVASGAKMDSADGYQNTKFQLYEPRGMAYDTTTHSLFIADSYNQRVVQILSDGTGRRVAGRANRNTTDNSSTNATGILALEHYLQRPMGVTIDIANRYLYVASYDGDHIKRFDISNADYTQWTGEIIVGRVDSNGAVLNNRNDDDFPYGYGTTTASTNEPTDLKISNDGSLLFFIERASSELKVVNLSGGAKTLLNGAINIPAGEVRKIMGIQGDPNDGVIYSSAKFRTPFGLELLQSGSTILGFFISNYDRDTVTFVNNTAGDVTLGGKTVASNYAGLVFGTFNGDGYNGINYSGYLTKLYTTEGICVSSTNKLVVTSRDAAKVLSLDIAQSDGNVSLTGNWTLYEDFIQSVNPNDVRLRQVRDLKFNSDSDEIYLTDYGNGRLRKFNTITGTFEDVLGLYSWQNTQNEQELPQDVRSYNLADMDFYNGQLLFVDRTDTTSTDRHCLIRAYNESTVDLSFWGSTVQAGRVATIGGNYALGCHRSVWDPVYEGAHITDVRLMDPYSIMVVGDDIYTVNRRGHCILKTDSSGVTTTFLGECGTEGYYNLNFEAPIGSPTIRLSYPSDIVLDPEYASDGNFIFLNRSFTSYSKLVYVNQSASEVTFGAITIPAGELRTVAVTNGDNGASMAINSNFLCYTSGWYNGFAGSHTVRCIDRSGVLADKIIGKGPGIQLGSEAEGVISSNVQLQAPYGLTFDNDGNLYISEYYGNIIRKVKRWW